MDDNAETPLAGITVAFTGKDDKGNVTGCSGKATSDGGGNFMLMNLPPACVGPQLISYDGTTATSPTGIYAGVSLSYTLVAGQVVSSPVLIHLPRIDNAETVQVQQNSATDQVFNFHTLPGVKVTVYAGTTLTLADGTQPNPFPFVAISIPIDRLPEKIPTTGMLMPFIVAFQPANAVASQPVAVNFPNFLQIAPGTNVTLVTLDPTHGYMVPYGSATVSQDGSQFVANNDPAHPGHGYGLVHFDWHGPMSPNPNGPFPNCCGPNPPAPSPNSPNPSPGPNGSGGDPVDLATGIFSMQKTDLVLRSTLGNTVFSRFYQSNGYAPTITIRGGPFGVGTSHSFNYMLDTSQFLRTLSSNVTVPTAGPIAFVTPDGNHVPFTAQKDGTLICNSNPGYQGSQITASNSYSTYTLRLQDGTVYRFDVSSLGYFAAFLTSITDPNGNVTTLTRDSADPFLMTQIKDPAGRTLRFTYDGNDQIQSMTDSTGRSVGYQYDGNNLTQVTDAAGRVTKYTYAAYRMTSITDAMGNTYLTNTYDSNNKVYKQTDASGNVTTFTYLLLNPAVMNSPSLQTTVTDPLGRATVERFSTTGLLMSITNPLGQTAVFARDPQTNLVTSITDNLGRVTTSTYDTYGNTTSNTVGAGTGSAVTMSYTFNDKIGAPATITNGNGNVVTFSQDSAGNLTGLATPHQQLSFGYDTHGELISSTDASGASMTATYLNGAISTLTDGAGRVQHRTYDAVGRLSSVIDAQGRVALLKYNADDEIIAIFDKLGKETDVAWDDNGNLSSVTDALKHTTKFTYDSFNRRTSRTDPLGRTDTYNYDAAGNLIGFTDRRGISMFLAYDEVNRLKMLTVGNESTIKYTYDAGGRLATIVDSANGTIVRHYDGLDRVMQEVTPNGTVNYTYDGVDHKLSVQAGSSPAVLYTYDADERITQVAQGANTATYAYDSAGRLKSVTLPNGVTRTYAFDSSSAIMGLTYGLNGRTLGDLAYSHDPGGAINGVSGSFAATVIPPASGGSSYNAANQLTSNASATLSYDGNGNLVSDGTNTYTWNGRNQLVTIGNNKATFQYDALDRRISKTVGGVTTGFLYSGDNAIQELTNGNVTATMLAGPKADDFLARTDSSGTTSLLTDVTNSTIGVTDANGNLASGYTYGPFGSVQTTSTQPVPYQYTGRENDATGLFYYRARYYSPALSRFISEDSAEFGSGINRYAYTGNDPVDARDPSGHFLQIVAAVALSIAADALVQYLTRDRNKPFSYDLCEGAVSGVLGGVTGGLGGFASKAVGGLAGIAINGALGAGAGAAGTDALNSFEGQNNSAGAAEVAGLAGGLIGGTLPGDSAIDQTVGAGLNFVFNTVGGLFSNSVQDPSLPKTPSAKQQQNSSLCHTH